MNHALTQEAWALRRAEEARQKGDRIAYEWWLAAATRARLRMC